uniref:Uncharacterized protein n=1 Tax=Cacopsylla melanoneura TaxID=428564 RepID=A0A8D9EI12_9HEMI
MDEMNFFLKYKLKCGVLKEPVLRPYVILVCLYPANTWFLVLVSTLSSVLCWDHQLHVNSEVPVAPREHLSRLTISFRKEDLKLRGVFWYRCSLRNLVMIYFHLHPSLVRLNPCFTTQCLVRTTLLLLR